MIIRACCQTMLLLGYLVLVGCRFPLEYVELMKLPEKQRHERFRELPINKEVEFYLLRATFSHPPDTSFAGDISARGEEAIPYLLDQLKREPDDHRKYYIVRIFKQIHVDTVDLRPRKEVINALEQAVNQIKDSDWQRMAQRSVQSIKEIAPKYAADYTPGLLDEQPPQPPQVTSIKRHGK